MHIMNEKMKKSNFFLNCLNPFRSTFLLLNTNYLPIYFEWLTAVMSMLAKKRGGHHIIAEGQLLKDFRVPIILSEKQ